MSNLSPGLPSENPIIRILASDIHSSDLSPMASKTGLTPVAVVGLAKHALANSPGMQITLADKVVVYKIADVQRALLAHMIIDVPLAQNENGSISLTQHSPAANEKIRLLAAMLEFEILTALGNSGAMIDNEKGDPLRSTEEFIKDFNDFKGEGRGGLINYLSHLQNKNPEGAQKILEAAHEIIGKFGSPEMSADEEKRISKFLESDKGKPFISAHKNITPEAISDFFQTHFIQVLRHGHPIAESSVSKPVTPMARAVRSAATSPRVHTMPVESAETVRAGRIANLRSFISISDNLRAYGPANQSKDALLIKANSAENKKLRQAAADLQFKIESRHFADSSDAMIAFRIHPTGELVIAPTQLGEALDWDPVVPAEMTVDDFHKISNFSRMAGADQIAIAKALTDKTLVEDLKNFSKLASSPKRVNDLLKSFLALPRESRAFLPALLVQQGVSGEAIKAFGEAIGFIAHRGKSNFALIEQGEFPVKLEEVIPDNVKNTLFPDRAFARLFSELEIDRLKMMQAAPHAGMAMPDPEAEEMGMYLAGKGLLDKLNSKFFGVDKKEKEKLKEEVSEYEQRVREKMPLGIPRWQKAGSTDRDIAAFEGLQQKLQGVVQGIDENNLKANESIANAMEAFMNLSSEARAELGGVLYRQGIPEEIVRQLYIRTQNPDWHFTDIGVPMHAQIDPEFRHQLERDGAAFIKAYENGKKINIPDGALLNLSAAAKATGLKVAQATSWGTILSLIWWGNLFSFIANKLGLVSNTIRIPHKGTVLEYRKEDVAQVAFKHHFAKTPLMRNPDGTINVEDDPSVKMVGIRLERDNPSPLMIHRKHQALHEMLHDSIQVKTTIALTVDTCARKIAENLILKKPLHPSTGAPLSLAQLEAIARREIEAIMPDEKATREMLLKGTSLSILKQGLINYLESEIEEATPEKQKIFTDVISTFKDIWDDGETLSGLGGPFGGTVDEHELKFDRKFAEIFSKDLDKYDDMSPTAPEYSQFMTFLSEHPKYLSAKAVSPRETSGIKLMKAGGVQEMIAQRIEAFANGTKGFEVSDSEEFQQAGFFGMITGEVLIDKNYLNKFPGTAEVEALNKRDAGVAGVREEARKLQALKGAANAQLKQSVEGLIIQDGVVTATPELLSKQQGIGAGAKNKPIGVPAKTVVLGHKEYPNLTTAEFYRKIMGPRGEYPKRLHNLIERGEPSLSEREWQAKLDSAADEISFFTTMGPPYAGIRSSGQKASDAALDIAQNIGKKSNDVIAEIEKDAKGIATYADDCVQFLEQQLIHATPEEHKWILKEVETLKEQSRILHQMARGKTRQMIGQLGKKFDDMGFAKSFMKSSIDLAKLDQLGKTPKETKEQKMFRIISTHSESGFYDLEFTKQLESYIASLLVSLESAGQIGKRPEIAVPLRYDLERIREAISTREFAAAQVQSAKTGNPIWQKRVGDTWSFQCSPQKPAEKKGVKVPLGQDWVKMGETEKVLAQHAVIRKWITKDRLIQKDPVSLDVQKMIVLPVVKDPKTDALRTAHPSEIGKKGEVVRGITVVNNPRGFLKDIDGIVQKLEDPNQSMKTPGEIAQLINQALAVYALLAKGDGMVDVDQQALKALMNRVDNVIGAVGAVAHAKEPQFDLERRLGEEARKFAVQFGNAASKGMPLWKQIVGGTPVYQSNPAQPKGDGWKEMSQHESVTLLSQLAKDFVTPEKLANRDAAAVAIKAAVESLSVAVRDPLSGEFGFIDQQIRRALPAKDRMPIDENVQPHEVLEQIEDHISQWETEPHQNTQAAQSVRQKALALTVFLNKPDDQVNRADIEKFLRRTEIIINSVEAKFPLLHARETQFNQELHAARSSDIAPRIYLDPNTGILQFSTPRQVATSDLVDPIQTGRMLMKQIKALEKLGKAAPKPEIPQTREAQIVAYMNELAQSPDAERVYYDPISYSFVLLKPDEAKANKFEAAGQMLRDQIQVVRLMNERNARLSTPQEVGAKPPKVNRVDEFGVEHVTFEPSQTITNRPSEKQIEELDLEQRKLDMLLDTILTAIKKPNLDSPEKLMGQFLLAREVQQQLSVLEIAGMQTPIKIKTVRKELQGTLDKLQKAIVGLNEANISQATRIAKKLKDFPSSNLKEILQTFVGLPQANKKAFAEILFQEGVSAENIIVFTGALKAIDEQFPTVAATIHPPMMGRLLLQQAVSHIEQAAWEKMHGLETQMSRLNRLNSKLFQAVNTQDPDAREERYGQYMLGTRLLNFTSELEAAGLMVPEQARLQRNTVQEILERVKESIFNNISEAESQRDFIVSTLKDPQTTDLNVLAKAFVNLPHKIRQTLGQLLLDGGVNKKTLQDFVGAINKHLTPEVTQSIARAPNTVNAMQHLLSDLNQLEIIASKVTQTEAQFVKKVSDDLQKIDQAKNTDEIRAAISQSPEVVQSLEIATPQIRDEISQLAHELQEIDSSLRRNAELYIDREDSEEGPQLLKADETLKAQAAEIDRQIDNINLEFKEAIKKEMLRAAVRGRSDLRNKVRTEVSKEIALKTVATAAGVDANLLKDNLAIRDKVVSGKADQATEARYAEVIAKWFTDNHIAPELVEKVFSDLIKHPQKVDQHPDFIRRLEEEVTHAISQLDINVKPVPFVDSSTRAEMSANRLKTRINLNAQTEAQTDEIVSHLQDYPQAKVKDVLPVFIMLPQYRREELGQILLQNKVSAEAIQELAEAIKTISSDDALKLKSIRDEKDTVKRDGKIGKFVADIEQARSRLVQTVINVAGPKVELLQAISADISKVNAAEDVRAIRVALKHLPEVVQSLDKMLPAFHSELAALNQEKSLNYRAQIQLGERLLEIEERNPSEAKDLRKAIDILKTQYKEVDGDVQNLTLEFQEAIKREVRKAHMRRKPDLQDQVRQNIAKDITASTIARAAGISEKALTDRMELRERVLGGKVDKDTQSYYFNNLEKWFKDNHIVENFNQIYQSLIAHPEDLTRHTDFKPRLDSMVEGEIQKMFQQVTPNLISTADQRHANAEKRLDVRSASPSLVRFTKLLTILENWKANPFAFVIRTENGKIIFAGKENNKAKIGTTSPTLSEFRYFKEHPKEEIMIHSVKGKQAKEDGKDFTDRFIMEACYVFVKEQLHKPQKQDDFAYLLQQEALLEQTLLGEPIAVPHKVIAKASPAKPAPAASMAAQPAPTPAPKQTPGPVLAPATPKAVLTAPVPIETPPVAVASPKADLPLPEPTVLANLPKDLAPAFKPIAPDESPTALTAPIPEATPVSIPSPKLAKSSPIPEPVPAPAAVETGSIHVPKSPRQSSPFSSLTPELETLTFSEQLMKVNSVLGDLADLDALLAPLELERGSQQESGTETLQSPTAEPRAANPASPPPATVSRTVSPSPATVEEEDQVEDELPDTFELPSALQSPLEIINKRKAEVASFIANIKANTSMSFEQILQYTNALKSLEQQTGASFSGQNHPTVKQVQDQINAMFTAAFKELKNLLLEASAAYTPEKIIADIALRGKATIEPSKTHAFNNNYGSLAALANILSDRLRDAKTPRLSPKLIDTLVATLKVLRERIAHVTQFGEESILTALEKRQSGDTEATSPNLRPRAKSLHAKVKEILSEAEESISQLLQANQRK